MEAAVLFPQYLPRIARLSPTRYRPTPGPRSSAPSVPARWPALRLA